MEFIIITHTEKCEQFLTLWIALTHIRWLLATNLLFGKWFYSEMICELVYNTLYYVYSVKLI